MINYIWFFMLVSGLVVSIISGRGAEITKAITDSTSSTVTFVISLVGIMCLWCGIMKIAEESKLTNKFAQVLKPILKLLFKEKNNERVMGPIVMNLTTNILGLGNAATPFGIKAMNELNVVNDNKGVASNDMALFLVLNANCIQLFPTTILSIRSIEGSNSHGIVLISIVITTFLTCIISILICKLLQKIF